MLSQGDLALMNDVLVGLSNAKLTTVETPGPLADNGDPGTPVPVWTGEAQGFLAREDRDVLSAGVQVRVRTDTFLLFDREGVEVGLAIGSVQAGADWEATTVVISDERLTPPILRRWTISGMEHDVDGTLDCVKLILNGDVAA